MSRILIFGDSIAYGRNDDEGGGWAIRLRLYLDENRIPLYNFSTVEGDTTKTLLGRFETEAKLTNPGILIIAIGINDSRYFKSPGNFRVMPDQFRKNLNELVRQARNYTDKIIFIGLTRVDESKVMPIPWNPSEYYTNDSAENYDQIVKSIAESEGLIYVEIASLLDPEDFEDGLHPDTPGHEKIFEKVKDELEKLGYIS